MNRPFYVHTPTNRYGEHLKACPFTIRSTFKYREDLITIPLGKDFLFARKVANDLNDKLEAELMAVFI